MIRLERKTILLFIALLAIIAGGTYLLYALGLIDLYTSKQKLLHVISEHRASTVLIFIGLQIIQVLAAPIPGEVTGLVGGMIFGTFWGVVYSTIGLTIGSWLAFLLARAAGRPLVESIAKPETIKRYDYVMKHKGLFLAFLMFLIPGFPKDILCYILGLGHMRARDFLLVSTSGRMLGTVLLTVGGTFIRDKRYGAFFIVASIGVAVILLTMIYRQAMERWFRNMRAAQISRHRAKRRKAGAPNDRNNGKVPRDH